MFAIVLPVLLTLDSGVTVYPLTSTKGLEVINATMNSTVYKGRQAVELTEVLDPLFGDLAVIKGSDFHNGTIDFDVAGTLTNNAAKSSRSFVGIAFRASDDLHRYENFYLRMTNGRSQDQELRNHAVQYCSPPEYTWDLLRQKRPFRYEAYTDLVLGEWTHVKISVQGTEAKFYVGGAKQPTLIVHDLLAGDTHGKIALWVAAHTHGYFSNLRVRPA
jgi:hypothetical protein